MRRRLTIICAVVSTIFYSQNFQAQSKHQFGVNVISGIDYLMDAKLDQPEYTLQYKRLGSWNIRGGINYGKRTSLDGYKTYDAEYQQDTSGILWLNKYRSNQEVSERVLKHYNAYVGIEKNFKLKLWDFQIGADFIYGIGRTRWSSAFKFEESIYDQYQVLIDQTIKEDLFNTTGKSRHLGTKVFIGVERALSDHFSLGMQLNVNRMWYNAKSSYFERYSGGELIDTHEWESDRNQFNSVLGDPLVFDMRTHYLDVFVNFRF